ncbi:hypothetical protein D9Q98_002809 [Chlorella vulgaris]|uniref:Thioredoxin domain-containing protein n=1 Tax=Chlorella vulgaris TaxID=3077 RepID=A0A9D4TTY6_CHLVU|nr:hypothetical protein D9Q98_002809 [Chlorella vulgaris]
MHSVAAARAPCAAPLAVRRATCTPRCQPVVQPWLRPAGAAITKRRNIAAQASKQTNIEQVDSEGLEAAILNRDRPLIIDFYATWCGPCVLLAKELETVAEKMGDAVRILKIDTDKNPDISTQLQIHGLPTLIFVGMDASKPALRTEGLLPAQVIQEIVERDLVGTVSEEPAQ